MPKVFIYVVARDFGFAPNPFHGFCSLATCKPNIRRTAMIGDWVIGVGGKRLTATGKCLYAMKITRKIDFDTYWNDPAYRDKKPVRNGSLKMMVGDNIYHSKNGKWIQADSHHSNIDRTPNNENLVNDTKSTSVLISEHFYYFGKAAINIPKELLNAIGYRNGIGHRTFPLDYAQALIALIESEAIVNGVMSDPFDFDSAGARYSRANNKIIRMQPGAQNGRQKT